MYKKVIPSLFIIGAVGLLLAPFSSAQTPTPLPNPGSPVPWCDKDFMVHFNNAGQGYSGDSYFLSIFQGASPVPENDFYDWFWNTFINNPNYQDVLDLWLIQVNAVVDPDITMDDLKAGLYQMMHDLLYGTPAPPPITLIPGTHFPGWCIDLSKKIQLDYWHYCPWVQRTINANMLLPFSAPVEPNLNAWCNNPANLVKVNYLLSEWRRNAMADFGLGFEPAWEEIQAAIWILIDENVAGNPSGPDPDPSDPNPALRGYITWDVNNVDDIIAALNTKPSSFYDNLLLFQLYRVCVIVYNGDTEQRTMVEMEAFLYYMLMEYGLI